MIRHYAGLLIVAGWVLVSQTVDEHGDAAGCTPLPTRAKPQAQVLETFASAHECEQRRAELAADRGTETPRAPSDVAQPRTILRCQEAL